MKKVFAIFLAMCMVLSMTAYASGEASADAGLTITDVAYGANYVATAATDDDTINSPSASSNIAAVTLSDGTVIEAENGGVLTLVVNGDQYDILDYVENGTVLEPGTYSFETTAGTATYSEAAKFMNMAGSTAQYTYRSALKVNADGIVADETIPALLTKVDSYDESSIASGEMNLNGAFFNGIIVDSTDYVLDGVNITAIGDGANDFQGEGAAVLAQGTADVTIQDSVIITAGVIRTAAVVKGNGILRIDNSVVYAQETQDTPEEYEALVVPMMKRTPMALGLEGGVRATNVLGAGQGIYTDSLIVSTGWGTLSTDSGSSYASTGTYALDVNNVVAGIGVVEEAVEGKTYDATKTVGGVTYGFNCQGSGYIAYADANVYDYFENSTLFAGSEVGIIAGGYMEFVNCDLNSNYIGIMTHGSNCEAYITDSDVNVGYTVMQIKSGSANSGCSGLITLDNANVTFTGDANYTGTLVELIESDDAGNPGVTEFTINDLGEEAYAVSGQNADAVAELKNGEYTGNIWNNIFSEVQALDVTVDNATLNGTISSSIGHHVDLEGNIVENGTVLQADTTGNYLTSGVTDYAVIGAIYNTASTTINNPVNVTLTNGATWNIVLADGTNGEADGCYIQDLTAEAGTVITAEAPVTVYYCGELNIDDAEVSENITFVPVERDVIEIAEAASSYSVTDYAFNTLTVNVVDANGDPVEGAINFSSNTLAKGVYFNASAATGYQITSGLDGYDSDEAAYTYFIDMEADTTITIEVAVSSASGEASGEAS
jgi:hypothetical protein